MDVEEFARKQLSEARTTIFEGVVIGDMKDFIIIVDGFCVHHDPPDNPCPFMEHEKTIIPKDDIVGDVEVLERVSAEGDPIARVRVTKSATVIVERSAGMTAAEASARSMAFPWPKPDWPWCRDDSDLPVASRGSGGSHDTKLRHAEARVSKAFAAMKHIKTRDEAHRAVEAVVVAVDEARRASEEVGVVYSVSSWFSDAIEAVGDFVLANEDEVCGVVSGVTGGILGAFAALSSGNAAIGLAGGVGAADKLFDKCTSG